MIKQVFYRKQTNNNKLRSVMARNDWMIGRERSIRSSRALQRPPAATRRLSAQH